MLCGFVNLLLIIFIRHSTNFFSNCKFFLNPFTRRLLKITKNPNKGVSINSSLFKILFKSSMLMINGGFYSRYSAIL